MDIPPYEGLVAATVTPMHKDGTINTSAIPPFIDFLVQTHVKAVFVNGSTGEWPSLSVQERKTITEAWMKYGRGKLDRIIVHCGALSNADAKELAEHAAQLGADAIACIAPSFFRPPNEEYLVEYLATVAAVAPKTPFLYYHIPSLSNMSIDVTKFLGAAHERIPTFTGLKVTTLDFHEVYECLVFGERKLDVYYGGDTQLLPALVMGVKTAIGHFYNFLGKDYNEMIKHFQTGNLEAARDIQIRISLNIWGLFKKYGTSVIKVMTSLVSGIDLGPNRLPMKHDFTDKEINDIKNVLMHKGFLGNK